MDKHPIEAGIEDVVRTYELLDRVRVGREILIRDDQFDREVLLDAARRARMRRTRMSLLDTGRFDPSELEWLIREKVRTLTSDEARPHEGELARILRACRKARSVLAYFQNGPLEAEAADGTVPLPALHSLASSGMDIHISNRARSRDFGILSGLAEDARKGRAFFVYYHHGPLSADMTELASRGAWVHFSDRSLGAADLALEILRAACEAGSRGVVYVEQGQSLGVLEALFAAGAAVLFRTPPSDHRSLLRPFELQARKRRLPLRASYLTTTLLP